MLSQNEGHGKGLPDRLHGKDIARGIPVARMRLYHLARVAATLLVAIAFFGAVYGRALQRRFPEFVSLIPYVGVLVILLALLLGIRNLGKLNERHSLRQHFHPSSRLLFLGLGGALLIVVVCEAMIVLPIERIHFLKYGLLALCIFLSFPRLSKTRRFALSTLLTSLVGCAEESLQILVPDRFFDWRDIAINVLAAALGASYACLLHAQTGVAEDSERRVGGH